MLQLAVNIWEIIKCYRNKDGIFITPEYIVDWALQFGSEQKAIFVLSELLHILPEVYLSEEKAIAQLSQH